MIADVSIDVDSPEQYAPVAAAAWIAIGVYAVGLFVLNAALLFLARESIMSNKPTPLSKAIRFLWKECACVPSWREHQRKLAR